MKLYRINVRSGGIAHEDKTGEYVKHSDVIQMQSDLLTLANAVLKSHKDMNCGNNRAIDFLIIGKNIKECPACQVARRVKGE